MKLVGEDDWKVCFSIRCYSSHSNKNSVLKVAFVDHLLTVSFVFPSVAKIA